MKHCLPALLLALCTTLLSCGDASPTPPPAADGSAPAPSETQDADHNSASPQPTTEQNAGAEEATEPDPSTWIDPVVVTLIHEQAYRYLQDPDAVEEPVELDGHGPVVILLNDNRIENHMFAAALNTLAQQDPARPVLIRADQSLYYSTLAPLFETISNSDFTGPMHMVNISPIEIDLAVPEPDESQALQENADADERVRVNLSITLAPNANGGGENDEPTYAYSLNAQAIAFDALGQALQALGQDNPDIELVMHIDPRVEYSTFVQVVSLAEDAGITSIAIAARAEPDAE